MPSGLTKLVQRVASVQSDEAATVMWSFVYFFCLLCAYYIIRPMRDEMGILGGVDNLQWLFTATLVVMAAAVPLYGWISSVFPRQVFLPWVYGFFIINLLLFHVLIGDDPAGAVTARAFFVWTSVFNLFIVSVFCSFMADIYSNEQARRLFGLIAAGGTAGALAGPLLTASLVQSLGANNLLLVSAALLGLATLCIRQLVRLQQPHGETTSPADGDSLGGSAWEGFSLVLRSPYLIAICLLMLLFTTLATFLYFMQAEIIRDSFDDSNQRTAVFAAMDFAVNALTLLFQLALTARLIKWLGLAMTLALVPLLLALGFVAIGLAPVLAVLVMVQVIRRAGNYAIMRPAREMLYVVLSRREKYKAKAFIDTFVYRGGDAVSAWVFAAVRGLGLELSAIALLSAPIALLWAVVSFKLGKRQSLLAAAASTAPRSIDR